jgi:hypothetical protein
VDTVSAFTRLARTFPRLTAQRVFERVGAAGYDGGYTQLNAWEVWYHRAANDMLPQWLGVSARIQISKGQVAEYLHRSLADASE